MCVLVGGQSTRSLFSLIFSSSVRNILIISPFFCCCPRGGLKASLDEVESIEGLIELDDKMQVMIISDENEMGQVRSLLFT